MDDAMTLFGPDEPTEKLENSPATDSRPKWTSVHGRRCDQCVVNRMRDPWQPIAPARLRRVGDGSDMRLCYEHARPVREQDERNAA